MFPRPPYQSRLERTVPGVLSRDTPPWERLERVCKAADFQNNLLKDCFSSYFFTINDEGGFIPSFRYLCWYVPGSLGISNTMNLKLSQSVLDLWSLWDTLMDS